MSDKMPAHNEGFGVRRSVVSWDTSQDFGSFAPVRALRNPARRQAPDTLWAVFFFILPLFIRTNCQSTSNYKSIDFIVIVKIAEYFFRATASKNRQAEKKIAIAIY